MKKAIKQAVKTELSKPVYMSEADKKIADRIYSVLERPLSPREEFKKKVSGK